MLNLTEKQKTLLTSEYKDVVWTFTVITTAGTTYRWGNRHFVYYCTEWGDENTSWQDGYDFENEVFEYKGLIFDFKSLNRSRSEINIHVPDELIFSISNKDNTLSPSEFDDATILVSVHISNGFFGDKICTWKLNVKRCFPITQTLQFTCVDFLTKYLEGEFGELIQNLFPSNTDDSENNFCIPASYGTCFIPCTMPYIDDQRYILLGKADSTYNIDKIKAPDECGGSVWPENGSNTHFLQSIKTVNGEDYALMIPLIAKHTSHIEGSTHTGLSSASSLICSNASWATDFLVGHYITNETDPSNACGTIISNTRTKIVTQNRVGNISWDNGDEFIIWAKDPVWKSASDTILFPRIMFSKESTRTMTNPAYVIEDVLKKFGTEATDINSEYISACAASFDDRNLKFRGAFYYTQKKEDIISNLLTMCHSKIDVTDKIDLQILKKASVATITSNLILKKSEFGDTSFKTSYFDANKVDSGYAAFQEWDKPQDTFFKILVSAKNNAEFQDNKVLAIPFVQDSIQVQKIACLAFQKTMQKSCNINHKAKGNLAFLQTGDVVTIKGSNYGSESGYDVVVDTIKMSKDLEIDIGYTRFKNALDDWDDLNFNAVSVAATEISISVWKPVISGPNTNLEGNNIPNQILGNLRIGQTNTFLNIDADAPNMAFYEAAKKRFLVGDLSEDNYGIQGLDNNENVLFEVSTKQNEQPFVSGYPDHKAMELEMMKLNFQHISWAQFAIYDAFDDETKRRNPDIGPYDARIFRSMLDNSNDLTPNREFIFTSKTYENITTVETGISTSNGSGFLCDSSKKWFENECKNLTLVDQSLVEFNVDSCSGSTLYFTGVPSPGIYSLKDDAPQYAVGFCTLEDSSNGGTGSIKFEVSFNSGSVYQTLYATGSTNLLGATVDIDVSGHNYVAKLTLTNNGAGEGPKVYNYLVCTDPSPWRF